MRRRSTNENSRKQNVRDSDALKSIKKSARSRKPLQLSRSYRSKQGSLKSPAKSRNWRDRDRSLRGRGRKMRGWLIMRGKDWRMRD